MAKKTDLPSAKYELDSIKRNDLIYKKILETSADGFIVVDKDGYIIDINRPYYEFLGYKSNQEIIGKHILEVIKNSELPEILLSGRTEIDVVHKFVEGQGGKEHFAAVTRTAVADSTGIVAACGQIKFSRETKLLAEKLQHKDDELKYYKNELKRIIGTKYTFASMIGSSFRFKEAKALAEKAAKNDFSLLITGETGTGKEVFATAVHNASNRRLKPFIRINCAAIPSELLESELFGYEEGSFTGAKKGGKPGKFEMAHGGTLFLDEIGEMPLNMQAKLLRVLQEKEVEKVGGTQPIPIDVRIIAATNQDLDRRIKNQTFRADLYYRLNVIQIKVPSLRERIEDIQEFTDSFLQELFENYGSLKQISSSALKYLQEYNWPGNIRELKNVIQRAYAMADDELIRETHLPINIIGNVQVTTHQNVNKSLDTILGEFEKEILLSILKKNNNNCRATAQELGIHRSTLYKKFEKFQIDIPRID